MDNIEIYTDIEKRITTHVVTGKISIDGIISVLEEFYSKTPDFHLLWDFSGADVSGFKKQGLEKILYAAKEFAKSKNVGKRAIVAPTDLGYGLARMYETFTELLNHSVSHKVFRSKNKAMDWLLMDT